ncbi:MAG: DUF2202 domain-containing protein [Deltaproteobacteria bacterium]|nr:MAG: DUF2202 domain-containing protein [Deltaproteobacteria bacterium]
MSYRNWSLLAASALLTGSLFAGCGSLQEDTSLNEPSTPVQLEQRQQGQQGQSSQAQSSQKNQQQRTQPTQSSPQNAEPSSTIQDALKEALFDEYKARAVYEKVLTTFGNVRPFSNIVGAEENHANALLNLYKQYGLTPPANPWNATNVPVYSSVQEACKAGVQAEIDNAAIYDRLLKLGLPQDIQNVFTNLRDASEDNHLAAFQRCAVR